MFRFDLTVCIVLAFAVACTRQQNVCNSGQNQSPIDIDTSSLETTFLPYLTWDLGYYEAPKVVSIESNGHTIVVNFDQTDVRLQGGPLRSEYNLNSIHFHWGPENSVGAEHLVNGYSYSMEIHAVHLKGNLTMDEATKLADGITVVGYFVEVVDEEPQELNAIDHFAHAKQKALLNSPEIRKNLDAFEQITSAFESLEDINQKEILPGFPLHYLIPSVKTQYVTYFGSLTTPNCDEAVTWILAPNTVKITQEQMDRFRSLSDKELIDTDANYRAVQDLNSRTVYYALSPLFDFVPNAIFKSLKDLY